MVQGLEEFKDFDVHLYADSDYYIGLAGLELNENINIGKINTHKYKVFPEIPKSEEESITILGR